MTPSWASSTARRRIRIAGRWRCRGMAADCVFCKIRDGQIPSFKIHEDERTLTFMDINPLNSGHCLVVTKAHAATIFEADAEDLTAAIAAAVQEDADAIGLSVLSGAHNYLFARVLELLKEKGADDIAVFGGGIIPADDIQALKAMGVKELFTPGASTQDIVRFVKDHIRAVV